jgi:hypothetical protein
VTTGGRMVDRLAAGVITNDIIIMDHVRDLDLGRDAAADRRNLAPFSGALRRGRVLLSKVSRGSE